MSGEKLKKIKAFSEYSNKLFDKQSITKEDTLMYPVFQQALHALQNVLINSENWIEDNKQIREKDFYSYGNNVIAFCGPRGQGKTSVMLSLSYALKHCDDSREKGYCKSSGGEDKSKETWNKIIDDRKFAVMPPIDPTLLEEKESVVGVVLAWLFSEINKLWKESADPIELIEHEKMEVLRSFQKCRDCLALHSGVKERDLSDLVKSSNILEFKQNFYAIISCFFQLSRCQDKKMYLVIQLDDTDMDMVNAYDVLEDVRKFLSLPQTVVLMATYLRQLRTLVAKHYEETLQAGRNSKAMLPVRADYMQMAAKYIDKLIPSQQMIHINSFRHQRDLNGAIWVSDLCDETVVKDNGDLEQEFYDLIKEKTGLIFVRRNTFVNNILPSTLRGLVHLYQLLDQMENPAPPDRSTYESIMNKDVSVGSRNKQKAHYKQFFRSLQVRQRNLILFEDYFRNDWCYNNLEEEDQAIMWTISQAHVAPKLRIIRNQLARRWNWVDAKTKDDTHKIQNATMNAFSISCEENEITWFMLQCKGAEQKGALSGASVDNVGNISFLEMASLLKEAEKRAESMNDLLLLFAVRTHLSIVMHKLYLSDILKALAGKETKDMFLGSNPAELDNGIYRWIDFTALNAFLHYSVPEALQDGKETRKEYSEDLRKLQKQHYDDRKRIEILYNMLLWKKLVFDDMERNAKPDADPPAKVSNNQYAFELQESVFRVLGNHDILRFFLSDEPERFDQCKGYVGKDEQTESSKGEKSVCTCLEKVRTASGDTGEDELGNAPSGGSSTAPVE